MSGYRGRFAPSPSGRMHLGNLYAGLLAYLRAKSQQGQVLLRIEDLDPLRCPKSYAYKIIDDLAWLGLKFDNQDEIMYQSDRSHIYAAYADRLTKIGLTYPCFCSRSDIHSASAPHASDGRPVYAGTCRRLTPAQRQRLLLQRPASLRVQVPNLTWVVQDAHYGPYRLNLAREWGDFIIRRSDGVWAYQLAVTVDDGLMGVTEVVRGRDLLSSSPVQNWLSCQLGFRPPTYFHLPLLINSQGERLAKRDLAADMETLKARFVRPEALLGYLGWLSGQLERPEAVSLEELTAEFQAAKLPPSDIIIP